MAKMNVDLSRLDSMIRAEKQELTTLVAEKLDGDKLIFSLRIYGKTTEQDMEASRGRAFAAKKAFYGAVAEAQLRLAYIAYLSEAREKANARAGVTAKLLEKADLERQIQFAQNVLANARTGAGWGESFATSVGELKEPDYYKSAFTENSRTQDVTLVALDQRDVDHFLALRDQLEQKRRACLDELAELNKKRKTEVLDFAEFAAQADS